MGNETCQEIPVHRLFRIPLPWISDWEYEHSDGSGNWCPFSQESNVVITTAERESSASVRLLEPTDNPPECRELEICFGVLVESASLTIPASSGICAVNCVTGDVFQVRRIVATSSMSPLMGSLRDLA